MSQAAFIDTNIPIYSVGRPHPLKEPCARILMLVAEQPRAFVTSAEVLQELLHYYVAVQLWVPQGREAFRRFSELMEERVEPVHAPDVQRSAELADVYPELGGRDLLHAAVMQRLEVRRIVSADKGFDRLAHMERLDPAQVSGWGHSI